MNFIKLPREGYINLDTVSHVALLRNKETIHLEGVRIYWAGTENEAGNGLCTNFNKESARIIIDYLDKILEE